MYIRADIRVYTSRARLNGAEQRTLCAQAYSSLACTGIQLTRVHIHTQFKWICTRMCMYRAHAYTVHIRVHSCTCSYRCLEHRVQSRTHTSARRALCMRPYSPLTCMYLYIAHMYTVHMRVHRCTCSYRYLEHRMQAQTHMSARSALCMSPYSSLMCTSVHIPAHLHTHMHV